MHSLTKVRRAQTEHRQQHEGLAPLRPVLTGTARRGVTPTDMEGLGTVARTGYDATGAFPYLEGYDDPPS